MNQTKTILRSLLLLLLITVGNISVTAQQNKNNPYGIDDHLYDIYIEATRLLQEQHMSPRILTLCDSMYNMAAKMGDKKAQCISYNARVRYYLRLDKPDYKQARKVAMQQRDFAMKTPYKQYVFDGWSNYLIAITRFPNNELLKEFKEFQDEAYRLNNAYGITRSYSFYSRLYWEMKQYDRAISSSRKSVEYQLSTKQTTNIHNQYYELTVYYYETNKLDSAIYYANKCLERSTCPENIVMPCLQIKGVIYCQRGKKDEAAAVIKQMKNKVDNINTANYRQLYNRVLIRYYANILQRYDEALNLCNQIQPEETRLKDLTYVYVCMGNYEKALKTYSLMRSSSKPDNIMRSLTSIDSLLRRNTAEAEMQESTLSKTMSELRQAELKAQTAKLKINLARELDRLEMLEQQAQQTESHNLRNQLSQEKIKLSTQRYELGKQKANAEAQKYKKDSTQTVIIFTAFALFIFVITCGGYIWYRHNYTQIIQSEHEKIENTNRLKDELLHNLQSDILQPINQIKQHAQWFSSQYEQHKEDSPQHAASIHEDASSIMQLVDKIINISKAEVEKK